MSFEEQERALFDLLFDGKLREIFCNDQSSALADYDLDEAEQLDFAEIRPDALEFDAALRVDLLLSHFCRAFPISFSIVSSLENGIDLLMKQIDTQIMRMPPSKRATVFGTKLRALLSSFLFDNVTERPLIIAILEAELGMAWTSAAAKQAVIEGEMPRVNKLPVTKDWSDKPIGLASYVSATVLPQPYIHLKNELCPRPACELWNHISREPLSVSLRKKTLETEDPKLLVARAHVSHASLCEPSVEHKTVELSEGFAHLFQHVNGTMSVEQILTQLKQAGAPDQLLHSVQDGFYQLLETSMLQLN